MFKDIYVKIFIIKPLASGVVVVPLRPPPTLHFQSRSQFFEPVQQLASHCGLVLVALAPFSVPIPVVELTPVWKLISFVEEPQIRNHHHHHHNHPRLHLILRMLGFAFKLIKQIGKQLDLNLKHC